MNLRLYSKLNKILVTKTGSKMNNFCYQYRKNLAIEFMNEKDEMKLAIVVNIV